MASFAAVIATLMMFAPQITALQRAAGEFTVEVRNEQRSVTAQGQIDAVLSRFTRDITMPPLCANPPEATNDDECSVFGQPHEAPTVWLQPDIEVDLTSHLITPSFQQDPARWGYEPQQPLCFIAHRPTPGVTIGREAQWGLNCLAWEPPDTPPGTLWPAPGVRPVGARKDPEGHLVFRSYEPDTNFNALAPQFDPNSGEDTEAVISGVAYVRVFWFDACGLVADEPTSNPCNRPDLTDRLATYQAWRQHLACDSCPMPATDVTADGTPTSPDDARTFTAQHGLRRVVLMMCPPDSPDHDGNGAGDCLDALREADTPAGAVGSAGDENRIGWSYVWRYELLF